MKARQVEALTWLEYSIDQAEWLLRVEQAIAPTASVIPYWRPHRVVEAAKFLLVGVKTTPALFP